MTNTLSRSQAKKWTLGAQLASGVFVLFGVSLGVMGLPEPAIGSLMASTGSPFDLPGAQTNTKDPAEGTSAPQTIIDTIGLAQRFALLDNAPIIVDNTVITPDPGADDTDPSLNDGEIAKRVRYIGFINDPAARHAFIRIDGKQRIVSQGQIAKAGNDEFADLTLEKITRNYIVMSDGQLRAQIKLASRNGQSITVIGGGNVDVAVAPNNNGSMLTAEDEAMIQGLPPRQQPRARTRLERERRGLSPDRDRRRPTPEPLARVRVGFGEAKKKGRDN